MPAMPTSEKFGLRWNDFQENISTAFESLRNDKDFTDVTLVCDDGHQLDSHKVILSAVSPFFQNLLRIKRHEHPLIYMRGHKYEDLRTLLDFVYYGEANIYQENLEAFLNIADDLKLKGLNRMDKQEHEDITKTKKESMVHKPTPQWHKNLKNLTSQSLPKSVLKSHFGGEKEETVPISKLHQELFVQEFFEAKECQTNLDSQNALDEELQFHDTEIVEMVLPQPKCVFSGDLQKLDETLDSMMTSTVNIISDGATKSTKTQICNMCGKEGKKSNMRDHIESHHLEGLSIPCFHCEKKFRTRAALRSHKKGQY